MLSPAATEVGNVFVLEVCLSRAASAGNFSTLKRWIEVGIERRCGEDIAFFAPFTKLTIKTRLRGTGLVVLLTLSD